MPRCKIQMGLIGDEQDRAKTFKRRKVGLVKKAGELAKLCDVDIAVVCAGPDGAAPLVWESDPGAVINRYRKLPADKRAKHTHRSYVNGELGKEKARLTKERQLGPKALACPGEAVLKDMNLEELLASIDTALLATEERRKALAVSGAGVPADDGQLGQVSSDAIVPVGQGGPPLVGGGDDLVDMQAWIDELMWDGDQPLPLNASMMQPASGVQYTSGDNVDTGINYQCQQQMLPGNGENGHGQLPWHAYQANTTTSYPDYGFQCPGNNTYVDMGYRMPVPSNANAYDGWCDQALWGADESSNNAVVPVAYPSLDIAGNPVHMPPDHEQPSMGIDSFVMDAGGHEYEMGCLADYFQCPDGSRQFEAEPIYLSDMAEGIGYCGMEAGSCSYGTGRAPFFAQSHSTYGTHQDQDPGVQNFWVMEGPPDSTDVATASQGQGETWANLGSICGNSRGLYPSWMVVQQ